MSNRGTRSVAVATAMAISFLVVAALSRWLGGASGTQSVPVWLAGGAFVGALLCAPRWSWSPIAIGAYVAAFIWGLVDHFLSPGMALVFAALEIAMLMLAAWIAGLPAGGPDATLRRLAAFVAGAAVTGAVGALIAVELWRIVRPTAAHAMEWRAWAYSETVGILLVAPLVQAFHGFRVKRSGGMPMGQFIAGAVCFGALLISIIVVFSPQSAERFGSIAATLGYVPMPLLVITALLWGTRGGALATLVASLLIIQRTAAGGGPFVVIEGYPGEAVVEVQVYVATMVLVVLIVQALSEGRRTALETSSDWRLRYERALDAAGVASVEFDAVTGRAVWGDGASHVLGPGVEAWRNVSDWHARIDAAERGLVEAAYRRVASGERLVAEIDYEVRLADGRDMRVHERLAAVRGPDGAVEQVAGLLRAEAVAVPGMEAPAHG